MQNFFKSNKSFSTQRKILLTDFQKQLNIQFKNVQLLDTAFHHRSFSNELANSTGNNECLEFLGDAVLGMVTATYLYNVSGSCPEGELAKIKSVVVSEVTLAAIALEIGVDKCLSLGKGEERSGGRSKKAILADALEAIFGAYYLDSGFAAVQKLIIALLAPEIEKVQQNRHLKDYKTLLQEFYQKKHKVCPIYKMIKKTGPDHDQTFWVSVFLDSTVYGPEQGKSKKEAEQAVARFAWERVVDS